MIAPNSFSADLLPSASAPAADEIGPSPQPRSGNASAQGSFEQLIGRTMNGDGSSNSSAPPSSPEAKQDKGDPQKNDKQKNQDAVASAVAQMSVMMPVPSPQAQAAASQETGSAQTKSSPTPGVSQIVAEMVGCVQAPAAGKSVEPTVPSASDPSTTGVSGSSETAGKPRPDSSAPAGGKLADLAGEATTPLDAPAEIGPGVAVQPPASSAAAEADSDLSVSSSGTRSAKQVVDMKSQDKAERSSQSAEKVLPQGNSLPQTAAQGTVEAAPRIGAASDHPAQTAQTDTDVSRVGGLAGVTEQKTLAVEDRTPPESVRPSRIEKVFNDITDQVVSFKRVGAESVDVNLRPDRGTEINLQLALNEGQVEVTARLQRGDLNSLGAHWSALQQSLAQQGVRVGQLESASFRQNQNQNHDQASPSQTPQQETNHRRERPLEPAPKSLDELPLVGASTEPLRGRAAAAPALVRKGWEMWA